MIPQEKLTSQAPTEILDETTHQQIQIVLQYCIDQVEKLVNMGFLEEVLSEEDILKSINEYISTNGSDINKFLGENGKTFIAMNSAEKFGDIFTKKLGISTDRITKIKISTYSDMHSSGEDISEESKEEIRTEMGLEAGDKVLIIEDLIDTGNTLKRLVDFIESLGVEIKIVCLFDKCTENSVEVRKILGNKLSKIIDVKDNFILGFGIDYEERMFAEIPGLVQVVGGKEMDFTTHIIGDYLNIIKEIKAHREKLLTLLTTPMRTKSTHS